MDVQETAHTPTAGSGIEPPLQGHIFAVWSRLGAAIIDMIVLMIISFLFNLLLGVILGVAGLPQQTVMLTGNIFGIVISWLYYSIQESSEKQATLGKAAMGLKVTDLHGERVSFLRATGRYFAKILSAIFLLIGYIMILFTAKKQGLHDILASTLVLREKKQS